PATRSATNTLRLLSPRIRTCFSYPSLFHFSVKTHGGALHATALLPCCRCRRASAQTAHFPGKGTLRFPHSALPSLHGHRMPEARFSKLRNPFRTQTPFLLPTASNRDLPQQSYASS